MDNVSWMIMERNNAQHDCGKKKRQERLNKSIRLCPKQTTMRRIDRTNTPISNTFINHDSCFLK